MDFADGFTSLLKTDNLNIIELLLKTNIVSPNICVEIIKKYYNKTKDLNFFFQLPVFLDQF